jgi:hypothetical protein
MSKATIESTKAVLESVLAEVEDSEQKFKIRTALQFLEALEQQEDEVVEVVEERNQENTEVIRRLRELGYVD